jgi:hypothetical protein
MKRTTPWRQRSEGEHRGNRSMRVLIGLAALSVCLSATPAAAGLLDGLLGGNAATPKDAPQDAVSGTYVFSAGSVTLTLELQRNAQGSVTGTLSSTAGGRFELTGKGSGNVAEGIGTDGRQRSYFKAEREGENLLFTSADLAADGKPVPATARELPFARKDGGGATGHGQRLLGHWQSSDPQREATLVFQSANRLVYNGEALAYQLLPGRVRVAGDSGYVDYPYRFQGEALIVTFPEEGYSLTFTKGSQGQAAADSAEPGGSATLVQHFAGNWWNATRNTETCVRLAPDGRFYENYTASYAEASSTPAWGIARDDNSSGRWTVQGTREQGVITFIYSSGKRDNVPYRVHVERGQTYWNEYFFNGTLYGKNAKP